MLETEVKPLVEHFLGERGLELSPDQTPITPIEDGFDFLGQHVRRYGDTVLVKPSRKNVASFLVQVRALLKTSTRASAGALIAKLNPIIRGWASFHRHVASKQTFAKVDHAIFQALWRWARRRHPKKSRRWIKDKYFAPVGNRNWVFQGTIPSGDGSSERIRLFAASRMSIRRHTKVKGDANPYDPVWKLYFEERLGVKRAATLRGKGTLLYLWHEQHGWCPVCNQKITTLTGWHNHHLVWRTLGGSDAVANRVLLHPHCHRQVHSQRLHVEKPAFGNER